MTDRFENWRIERIYNQEEPIETIGSQENGPWAGLYTRPRGGWIIMESKDGEVTGTRHYGAADLVIAWQDIVERFDTTRPEPGMQDYVIEEVAPHKFEVTPLGQHFDTFNLALAAAREDAGSLTIWYRDPDNGAFRKAEG